MNSTHTSALHRRTRPHRFDLGRALAVIVTLGLVVALTASLAAAATVAAGIAPALDQSIVLPVQHALLIHLGPRPTCLYIPNPPQHDCAWPGSERGVFSVEYLTPHGARLLVWLRLP